MSEDEILSSCQTIMFAGHETTANMLCNGLVELIRHPSEWAKLRDDPSLISAAIDELQRISPVVTGLGRESFEDFEWHGKQIKKGDVLYMLIQAANRNPRAYDDPDALDITCKNDLPHSFGPGIHFCLGAQLAKMELETAFNTILRRYEKIEMLDNEINWNNNIVVRGMHHLNLRLHPLSLKKGG